MFSTEPHRRPQHWHQNARRTRHCIHILLLLRPESTFSPGHARTHAHAHALALAHTHAIRKTFDASLAQHPECVPRSAGRPVVWCNENKNYASTRFRAPLYNEWEWAPLRLHSLMLYIMYEIRRAFGEHIQLYLWEWARVPEWTCTLTSEKDHSQRARRRRRRRRCANRPHIQITVQLLRFAQTLAHLGEPRADNISHASRYYVPFFHIFFSDVWGAR